MPRKKKQKLQASGSAPWLITFTDMMTLMLTFFILLVSMAVIDEQRRLIVLGSIVGTFGVGEQGFNFRSTTESKRTVEPGPLNDVENLELLKERLWEDLKQDLNFQSNRFVQILSVNDRVLFEPGSTELSQRGREILNRIGPLLQEIDYPLLLGGHTANLREEQGESYKVMRDNKGTDPSWQLAVFRTQSVYRHLLSLGLSPEKLRMQAFGRFRPRYPEETSEGRQRNMRVDIVLDKRNASWLSKVEDINREGRSVLDFFKYRDFRFNLSSPVDGI